MPSRPILQAWANTVGRSASMCWLKDAVGRCRHGADSEYDRSSPCHCCHRPPPRRALAVTLTVFRARLGLSERPSVLMPIPSAFLEVFASVLSLHPDGCEKPSSSPFY